MSQESEPSTVTIEAGPRGFVGRLTGFDTQHLFLILLILLCTSFVWWTANEDKQSFLLQHQITQGNQVVIIKLLDKIVLSQKEALQETAVAIREASDVQAFVLTRTQSQREALGLDMPRSLREQVINARNRK